ncbi:MAG: hypothetical protein H0V17_35295 [Deltaproteobacteria bacterium]|nr:hypothetical protein [Deltaproteobacteria bacterium]
MLVEVTSRRFAIPHECPCCGAIPETELAIPLTATPERTIAADTARSLLVPYCHRCVAHIAKWETAGVASAGIMLAGLVGGIVLALTVHVAVGVGVAVVAAPLAWLSRQHRRTKAKQSCGESCVGPGRAVTYLGWSGTTSAFELESHAYTARFAEANPSLLANPSAPLKKLIEGHRIARLAVPTPAASVVVPPPATVQDWVTRIEATSGTVARRALLQRGLDALDDMGQRQLVIVAASKLEISEILTSIEGLTVTLQQQRLQRAIDDIRADNMPEALQAAVLYELNAHLRAIR